MVEPLCPECRKKMAAHWTCDHCGFDPNRTKSKEKLVVLPYKCSRCDKLTQKKIDDIPVCGDCFTEGWGRLPSMELSPVEEVEDVPIGTEDAPLYVSDKPPKVVKRKSKLGG